MLWGLNAVAMNRSVNFLKKKLTTVTGVSLGEACVAGDGFSTVLSTYSGAATGSGTQVVRQQSSVAQ